MKYQLILLLVISFFSCKKEDEPKTKVNYASFKINGEYYEADRVFMETDAMGIHFLKMETGEKSIRLYMYTTFLSERPVYQGQAYYHDGSRLMNVSSGTFEMTDYRKIFSGSLFSGKFALTVPNPAGGPGTSITDGYIINVQSSNW